MMTCFGEEKHPIRISLCTGRPLLGGVLAEAGLQHETGCRLLVAGERQSLGCSDPCWGWRRLSLNWDEQSPEPALGWVQASPSTPPQEMGSQKKSPELREKLRSPPPIATTCLLAPRPRPHASGHSVHLQGTKQPSPAWLAVEGLHFL
ncbi:hypothetical protein mRhiFer1_009288 [Rhinolophus ferrumequinum]|uniref:Uncharacterized protein n=1 Tax=Rhinolophus ferrumequinum TaxID=59479 RepID=A0A7J7RXI4_RHIFE|nr:hypothetical protein mRhiFer1_009288 [Rhinolophus ferrumequinum]